MKFARPTDCPRARRPTAREVGHRSSRPYSYPGDPLRWFLDAAIPAVVVDHSETVREVNGSGERLLDASRGALLGQGLVGRVAESDRPTLEHVLAVHERNERNGNSPPVVTIGDATVELHSAPVRLRDGSGGICLQLVDRSDAAAREAQLQRMAFEDPMTGLLNRRGFDAAADQLLRIARREHRAVTFMFVDIEQLKLVNDSEGHATGDRMIQAAGSVLRSAFRDADAVGRYGGDEFVVVALTNARSSARRLRRPGDVRAAGEHPVNSPVQRPPVAARVDGGSTKSVAAARARAARPRTLSTGV